MKILFWNVDTQKDFCNKGGALYVEGVKAIKPTLKKLTELARKYKIQVVNTADWHNESDEEISSNPDFKNTFPLHCVANTTGAEFIEETLHEKIIYEVGIIDSEPDPIIKDIPEIVIRKDKFDVFEGNKWTEKVLEMLEPKIVIVYGVATNVCVDLAVKGLASRGYKVVVVKDAIKELPGTDISAIIENWKKNFKVQIADYKAVKFYIKMMNCNVDI